VIRFGIPVRLVNQPRPRIPLLENKPPRDLTKENKIVGNPDRFFGKVCREQPFDLPFIHR
jgi:hypothetical protein